MADEHEGSSHSGEEFRINTAYADRYNTWRRKEELQKLKDRYGDEDEDETSSTSEEEDEDAEALTPHVEKAWLRAYAAVKSKDPKIYESVKFFDSDDEDSESDSDEEKEKKHKEKPVYLKDYERKVILEKGGKLSDESEDEHEMITPGPSYFEEQDEIKKSIKEAVGSDSDSEDDLLQQRKKTKEEEAKEEADYLSWLKGQKPTLDDEQVGVELDSLRDYWNDPKLEPDEKFLRDFILNKRYIEKDDYGRIPTYAEIVDEEDLSEDEKTLEKQETFERKYNFRYEEPDTEYIKNYPRTIQDTVRRTDDRRKVKRHEVKERKEKEKDKKQEDLKQLKNLKKKEIMEKLKKLKEITGNPNVGFNEDDLEGDFDPAEYDRKVQAVFNDEYYDEADDDQKPVFDDDEALGLDEDDWENWDFGEEGEEYEPHCEDEDFNMDCDYDPSQPKKTKKERKSKLAQAVAAAKPKFDPADKTFEQYFDEYYKLDYEDIIDDLPCRFKYRQVPANDFGLSTDELFKCRDKELNAWVSLKKMSQHRTEEEELHDVHVYRRKSRNQRKKLNLLPSLKEEEKPKKIQPMEEAPGTSTLTNKRKRKLNIETDKLNGGSPSKLQKASGKKAKVETVSKAPPDEEGLLTRISVVPSVASPSKKDLFHTGKGWKVEPIQPKVEELLSKKTGFGSDSASGDIPSNAAQTVTVDGSVASVGVGGKKKRKRKKKRKGGAGGQNEGQGQGQKQEQSEKVDVQKNKGGNIQKKVKKPIVSDDRLKAYGINPKKFKFMDLQRAPKFKQQS